MYSNRIMGLGSSARILPKDPDASGMIVIQIPVSKNARDPDTQLLLSAASKSVGGGVQSSDVTNWFKGVLKRLQERRPEVYSALVKGYPAFVDPNMMATASRVQTPLARSGIESIEFIIYGRNGNPLPIAAMEALKDAFVSVFASDARRWGFVVSLARAEDAKRVVNLVDTGGGRTQEDMIVPKNDKSDDAAPSAMSGAVGIFLVVGVVLGSIWVWKKVIK